MEIIRMADEGEIELVWSFMHDDEARLCPFPERKTETIRLAEICQTRQGPDEEIKRCALKLVGDHKLSPKDALHLSAAIAAKADYFLTCDEIFAPRTPGKAEDCADESS